MDCPKACSSSARSAERLEFRTAPIPEDWSELTPCAGPGTLSLQHGVPSRRPYFLQLTFRNHPMLSDRITVDPAVCHGKPCVRGLRYPVEFVLELLSSGMTTEQVLADYEDLERDDILAVLAFAARLAQVKRIEPLAA